MKDRCKLISMSRLFGCLLCLMVIPTVNADGRVFVMNLRNSSGLQGFRDAERTCASQHARLASAQELHHAVVDCFFSPCTRGWLSRRLSGWHESQPEDQTYLLVYNTALTTTVCNIVGSTLKAVDVRAENATEDAANLNAFCIKLGDVPCGDPPAFPNARLQGHSGYEMGDELLYTCVPGYLMPSGHKAFSLLCDSCGEWYGLVEICVKDETEGHIDYEDKFTDAYGEVEHQNERPAEAHGEVYEEVHGAVSPSPQPPGTSLSASEEEEHQEQHEEPDFDGEVLDIKIESGIKYEERPVEDFVGHPSWEQESREVVTTDAAPATQAPVSVLSQKHLFWFPSEAFQEEGHPVSTNPVMQTTQRASGAQSEESKEQESQEKHDHHQGPVHVDVYAPDDNEQDTADQDDHNESNHDELEAHEDSHHEDQDDPDSQQEEDDGDEPVKHYIPAQVDRRDHYDKHEDHDDHYDMGEHEDERDRVRYGSQEYDDRDDTYDDHESYEDHGDLTDDHGEDKEHPDASEEHSDLDDHDDLDEKDSEHEPDQDDHDRYDDNDSHEVGDGHQHVVFSTAKDGHHNDTQKTRGGKETTDDTWLDGYPVVAEETENGESTTQTPRHVDKESMTDKPNEVELSRPAPHTNSPEVSLSDPSLEEVGVEEMLPGLTNTPAPSEPSDSPSYVDTLDYDTQQAAPTRSWLGGATEHPHLDQDPAPPMQDGDVLSGVIEEHTVQNLPGEAGERGEMEGEMGEAMCTGENCTGPPPSSSSRGPTVAAIIAVVCVVAAAILVGVWCYRRQKQKSSMYEMNGKGQSQSRHGQQIEMQQKV